MESTVKAVETYGFSETIRRTYRVLGLRLFGEYFCQLPLIQCTRRNSRFHNTFIDIVAYTRTITRAVARDFRQCSAVEPNPSNVKLLKKNLEGLSNRKIIEYALSDSIGTAKLYYPRNRPDVGSLTYSHSWADVEVPIMTLDKMVSEIKCPAPYLIKIDVQRYEYKVLRAGVNVLQQTGVIISEYSPFLIRSGCQTPNNILTS